MKKYLISMLMAAVCGGFHPPTAAADDAAEGHYKIYPLKEMGSLGIDIYKALKPKQREFINPEPISLETDLAPAIKLAEMAEDNKSLGYVFVTVGFLDLVENVAHAKAIDTIEKGYFDKYILSLAQETGEKEIKELPNIGNAKYWTEAIKNEHLSNFRQMVGTAVGVKLAHHFLGQYKKYAAKLEDSGGKRTPINNLLTPQEWDEALKGGVRLALEAGLGIEGIKGLYEAIDKMPKRPEWTTYFLPSTAKYKSMKKDLEKMEKKFFSGEE